MTKGLLALYLIAATPAAAWSQEASRLTIPSDNQPSFSIDDARQKCIEFRNAKQGTGPSDLRDCAVSEFGEMGSVGERRFFYSIYCVIFNFSSEGKCGDDSFVARRYRARSVAVFERNPSDNRLRLIYQHVNDDIGIDLIPSPPQLVNNAAGVVLYVPIAFDGTGNFNNSDYYLLQPDGAWQKIESEAWTMDLLKQLPQDREVWKGIWPNPETLEANAPLYRKGDGNCCPSGGSVSIKLAIESGKMVLKSVGINRVN